MDQPDYDAAVQATHEVKTGLVGGSAQPQGISFDAAKAARYAEARSMEARAKMLPTVWGQPAMAASEFDLRNAAMGFATTFETETADGDGGITPIQSEG